MGKAAKAHKAKVQKRNNRVKHEENILKKKWNEALQKQMEVLQEKFASMSGDTESNNLTEDLDTTLPDGTKVEVAGFHNVTEND
jgi:Fe-S cluster biosynthesis and repair protein YggX